MESPIFIVGANRSGTTLLRLILNAHSRVAIPDELIYFGSYLAGTPIEHWRNPDLSSEEYESFVDDFLASNCRPLNEIDKAQLKTEILAGPHDLRSPYRRVLEAWARHYGKERWGEKTPGNLFYVDIIIDMFPDAQFLYMVRDPRAGVASMPNVPIFPDDVTFNALNRRKHDTEGRAILERHVPPAQRMRVQYEDLVRHPETTVQSVCDFLGEAFDPQMLHFHEGAGQYMKEHARRSYNAAATQPITDDRIDAWKHQLGPDQIAAVEYVCAGIMQNFGYASTDRWPSLPTWGKILAKWMYWIYQCWRHRDVRHYTVTYPMFARTRTQFKTALHRMRSRLRSLSPFHSV